MPLPIRLTGPATASSSQQQRPVPPTPASVEGESSGRRLRQLQDVVREVRQPDRGDVLRWPELTATLPVRLG